MFWPEQPNDLLARPELAQLALARGFQQPNGVGERLVLLLAVLVADFQWLALRACTSMKTTALM